MSVDRDLVDHVAELARLRLDEDERREMTQQLGHIVEYVAQLESVDVTGVPPTAGLETRERARESAGKEAGRGEPGSTLAGLRDDEPGDCLSQGQALANAPDGDEGHFLVPRVLPDG